MKHSVSTSDLQPSQAIESVLLNTWVMSLFLMVSPDTALPAYFLIDSSTFKSNNHVITAQCCTKTHQISPG